MFLLLSEMSGNKWFYIKVERVLGGWGGEGLWEDIYEKKKPSVWTPWEKKTPTLNTLVFEVQAARRIWTYGFSGRRGPNGWLPPPNTVVLITDKPIEISVEYVDVY